MVNLIGLSIISLLIINQFFEDFALLNFLGQIIGLLLIIFSIINLFKGKIFSAGYLTVIGINTIILFEYVLPDFYTESIHYLRIYETLALILIGYMLLSLFAIKRMQILIYSLLAISLFLMHFVLIFELNEFAAADAQSLMALLNVFVFLFGGMIISFFTISKTHNLIKSIEVSRNKAHLKYKLLFNNMPIAYLNIKMSRNVDGIIIDAIINETNTAFNELCKSSGRDIEQKLFSQLPANIKELVGDLSTINDELNRNNITNHNRVWPETSEEFKIYFYTLKEDNIVALISKLE